MWHPIARPSNIRFDLAQSVRKSPANSESCASASECGSAQSCDLRSASHAGKAGFPVTRSVNLWEFDMKTFKTLAAIATLSAITMSPVFAADPPEHSHDQPAAKGANKGASSKASKEALSGMDARMKDMQVMQEKMMAARTPAERSALMAEHMQSMRDGMAMMDKAGGMGMKKDGGAGGGMDMKKGGGAGMSHEMMEKRMDMMQQMMKMMMERTAAVSPAK